MGQLTWQASGMGGPLQAMGDGGIGGLGGWAPQRGGGVRGSCGGMFPVCLAIGPLILQLCVLVHNSAQAQVWWAGGGGGCSEVHKVVISCVRCCVGQVCDS